MLILQGKDLFFILLDEWSMEDKVIFEQSFNSHGKHFAKIRANVSINSTSFKIAFYFDIHELLEIFFEASQA